jgi:hypothetical protein
VDEVGELLGGGPRGRCAHIPSTPRNEVHVTPQ